MDRLLCVNDLTICDGHDQQKVLVNNMSLTVNQGETVGIVGESGSGKSLTAQAIMRLLPLPGVAITAGTIEFNGDNILTLAPNKLSSIRGRDISMVFQEPQTALNPVHNIGKQLKEQIKLHQPQLSHSEMQTKMSELLTDVGLGTDPNLLKRFPHELSGGMRQRVVIAMALSCSPALLIADEPTTALDVEIQAQILELLKTLQKKYGMAMIFISHDLAVVAQLCDRILVMYQGKLIEELNPDQLLDNNLHPYTQALLHCNLADNTDVSKPWRSELPVIPSLTDLSENAAHCQESDEDRDQRFTRAIERYKQHQQNSIAETAFDPAKADSVLELQGINKRFLQQHSFIPARRRYQQVLSAVSLKLRQGETLGLVGASGSGKSTLSKIISGLEKQDSGHILFQNCKSNVKSGRDKASLIQYVFQDPMESLNPRHTIADILSEPLRIQGEKNSSVLIKKSLQLLAMCGLDRSAINKYPHQFSGGQKQRIGIARALALEPEILICDEPVSALDVSVQAQIINLLIDLQRRLGIAIIFISHDLTVVKHISHNIAVLHNGEIVEYGDAQTVFHNPQHTYTQRLIAATPSWRKA